MSHAPLRIVRVNTDAIEHNVRRIKEIAQVDNLMAVVKANAYGHGTVPAATAALAGGASWLGVADISEALQIRQAGITAPVLSWLHAPDETFEEAVQADVALAASSVDQLQAIAAAGKSAGVSPVVHLKIDTGLSRNGAGTSQWQEFFAYAVELHTSGELNVIGIMSHLSNTTAGDNLEQLSLFHEGVDALAQAGLSPELVHIAASEAALLQPDTRLNMVRSGIAIYGIAPTVDTRPEEFGLIPAMTLESKVVATKQVSGNSGVSYGYLYRTDTETNLALVPLGYGDGINRDASLRGPVVINGKRYQVAGRIAMDQFVVDVGQDNVSVGDRVVLFGNPAEGAPSVHEWEAAADSIGYEIVTRLSGARLDYVYTGAHA